jgi:hypothetical protein
MCTVLLRPGANPIEAKYKEMIKNTVLKLHGSENTRMNAIECITAFIFEYIKASKSDGDIIIQMSIRKLKRRIVAQKSVFFNSRSRRLEV